MARDTSFFTTVKEDVDLEDYLANHLNVELVSDGPGRMTAVCPFHEEDTPSFKVMESGDGPWKRWWCYGACQTGGSVLDAAMRAEGFDLAHEAAQYLNELYNLGLDVDSEAYQRFAKTVAETKQDIERTRESIKEDSKISKIARNYLMRRGFTDETIDHFQLGVDTSNTKSGRLSIPLIDKANHPVSIANRALFDQAPCQACGQMVKPKDMVKQRFQAKKAEEKGEKEIPDWKRCPHCNAPGEKAKLAWLTGQDPKYRFVRDFDKANFLYNENSTRHALKEETVLGIFMVEGYADVWAGWQSGHKAICSYNGAVMSDWQAEEVVGMASKAGKPVILIPDFDATGERNIDPNIRKLRAVQEDIEVQVVWGVDRLTYRLPGEDEDRRCKDLGDVLQHHGAEEVDRILRDQRFPAAEWMIRQIVEKKNSLTGEAFHSEQRQLQLVSEVLSHEKAKVALEHLVPYLCQRWEKSEEVVRTWFNSNLSEENVASYHHLFKDIKQARIEAREFLQDDNVIPLGFKEIDSKLPGGGARPGQLSMFLGKSGTGKAQPLSAQVLTPQGFRQMGDINPGDTVLTPDNQETMVTGVYPQGEREIFRVHFSDSSSTECDAEHLWKVRIAGEWKVITLDEIINSYDLESDIITIPKVHPDVFSALSQVSKDPEVERRMVRVEEVGVREAQCISLDSEEGLYVTDDYIVTHNTMLAAQMLGNMADSGTRSIIFSLEQAAKSLFPRLACQCLDKSMDEVEELIARDDEEAEDLLKPVQELYQNMLIVDNVPESGQDAMKMTPSRIQAVIQEANMTHFKGEPAGVVIIDHLGILEVDEDAPREVKASELAAPGYIMQRLFAVCKATGVFMMVLQQLPKEIPPGETFGYDAGRGGSKQTDFCDYIFQIWRPEQQVGLDENERLNLEGKYMLALGKNRYGGSTVAHLYFDKATLRIMPALAVAQPDFVNPDGPVIELEEATEGGSDNRDVGNNPEALAVLAEETDTLPKDNKELFEQTMGAVKLEGDDIDDFGDDWLRDE